MHQRCAESCSEINTQWGGVYFSPELKSLEQSIHTKEVSSCLSLIPHLTSTLPQEIQLRLFPHPLHGSSNGEDAWFFSGTCSFFPLYHACRNLVHKVFMTCFKMSQSKTALSAAERILALMPSSLTQGLQNQINLDPQ